MLLPCRCNTRISKAASAPTIPPPPHRGSQPSQWVSFQSATWVRITAPLSPAAVIEHAVWLYHCFSLSLQDVELILAVRGIVVSYESIREWGLRFSRIFANMLTTGVLLRLGKS